MFLFQVSTSNLYGVLVSVLMKTEKLTILYAHSIYWTIVLGLGHCFVISLNDLKLAVSMSDVYPYTLGFIAYTYYMINVQMLCLLVFL